jgi:hypothetical protein
VTEIISPSCPFPNESLSAYSYPKLSNCWRSMRKPSRPLDGRIEPGSLGLGCQHVRHQVPERLLYRTSRRLLRLDCINLVQGPTLCGVDEEALCARWSRSLL